MKKSWITLTLYFAFFLPAMTWAQGCDYFMPFRENAGMEFQDFNQRDRLQGSQQVIIRELTTQGDQLIATMHSKSFDRREKLQFEGDYDIICNGNELIIDFQSLMDQGMMEGFKDMEMRFEGQNIILPVNLSEGLSLPDAEMKVLVESNGMTFAEVNMKILNRMVAGKENITVPAGSFDCYKITYDTQMETKTMGIPFRGTTKTIEYHAPNIGVVRTEFFDDKDRLQGYRVLSKIL